MVTIKCTNKKEYLEIFKILLSSKIVFEAYYEWLTIKIKGENL